MSIKKSFFRFVATFLVTTFMFSSIYTAIGATTDQPDWIGNEEEIRNTNQGYVRPTSEEKAAADAKAAEEAAKAAEELAAQEAADKAAQEEAAKIAAQEAANAAAKRAAYEAQKAAEEKAAQEVADKTAQEQVAKTAADEALKVDKDKAAQEEAAKVAEGSKGTQENVDQVAVDAAAKAAAEKLAQEEKLADEKSAQDQAALDKAAQEAQSAYTLEEKAVVKQEVNKALADAINATGEGVDVYLGNGKYAKVAANDVQKFSQIAGLYAGSGKLSGDLNNNGIDDSVEVKKTGGLAFDEVAKKKASDLVNYGVTDADVGKVVIVSAPGEGEQVVGEKPLFKIKVVGKAGENLAQKKYTVKFISEDGVSVDSQSIETDENGVATYSPSDKLSKGKYSVVVSDVKGNVVDKKNIEVDNDKVPKAPALGFQEKKDKQTSGDGKTSSLTYVQASVLGADASGTLNSFDVTKYLVRVYIYRVFPYLDPRNEDVVAAAGIPVVQGKVPKVIEGHAKAGSRVYVTFKSIVRSAVVIADANQKFIAEVPDVLPDGNHEVLAFVYDPNNNFVGNIASFLFSK